MDITNTPLPYIRIPSSLYHILLTEVSNTERGIILALICYCAMNRNGGRIPNCRNWPRKKWARAAGIASADWTNRVRERDVDGAQLVHACPFLAWDGADLLVLAYPADDEQKACAYAGSRPFAAPRACVGALAPAREEEMRREIEENRKKNQYTPLF